MITNKKNWVTVIPPDPTQYSPIHGWIQSMSNSAKPEKKHIPRRQPTGPAGAAPREGEGGMGPHLRLASPPSPHLGSMEK